MKHINLINAYTDLSKVEMYKMNWDVASVKDDTIIEYQVYDIPDFVHTIGGRHGNNSFWCCRRDEVPTVNNLIQYNPSFFGANWGIKVNNVYYIQAKWNEGSLESRKSVIITRNGDDFYECHSLDYARYLLDGIIQDHPLNLNEIGFDSNCIGRKVWWRSQPGVITSFVKHRACVVIEPDGIDRFSVPPEFNDDDVLYHNDENYILADIFDKHIWWFRD